LIEKAESRLVFSEKYRLLLNRDGRCALLWRSLRSLSRLCGSEHETSFSLVIAALGVYYTWHNKTASGKSSTAESIDMDTIPASGSHRSINQQEDRPIATTQDGSNNHISHGPVIHNYWHRLSGLGSGSGQYRGQSAGSGQQSRIGIEGLLVVFWCKDSRRESGIGLAVVFWGPGLPIAFLFKLLFELL
jgi:hypothetical protein